MEAQFVYSDIICLVFEENLKDYFTDMFGVNTGIMFFNFSNYGCIVIDNINKQGFTTNIIPLFFLNDEFNYCKENETVYYVKFITYPLIQNDVRKSIENIPECFKEKNPYIFNLKHYKHLNVDYIKKEFLRSFLLQLDIIDDYLNYEKKQERLRLEKLLGEEVF